LKILAIQSIIIYVEGKENIMHATYVVEPSVNHELMNQFADAVKPLGVNHVSPTGFKLEGYETVELPSCVSIEGCMLAFVYGIFLQGKRAGISEAQKNIGNGIKQLLGWM